MSKIEIGKRYFIKMRPVRIVPLIGWAYTTSNETSILTTKNKKREENNHEGNYNNGK